MDPTTTAHSSAIHPSSLHSTTAADGTPILTTRPPATAGSTTSTTGTTSTKDTTPAATGLRQRVNNLSSQLDSATEHPAVKDAKKGALKQIDQLRQVLGRYSLVVEAEKRTGVDRVALVVGGVFLYILLIPVNLLGLALPTTNLLTFLPPMALAMRTLERPNDDRLRTLLSYFVVFGFVQFAESLMAGFLERKIPQYYTVKLLFLAYLIHPRTKGAQKIHQSVLRPLLATAQGSPRTSTTSRFASTTHPATGISGSIKTPPSSKPSQASSNANSPTFPSASIGGGTGTSGGSSGFDLNPTPAAPGFNLGGNEPAVHLPSGGGVSTGLNIPK